MDSSLKRVLSEIHRNGAMITPVDTVGLELKVALLAIGGGLGAATADNDFWLRKCRDLVLRPAVEPLLLAQWSKLKRFDMTEPQMAALCSLLSGSKQAARVRDSYGLWQGSDVCFESAELARTWWSDIQKVTRSPELNSLLPFYCYARTIIAHPFPDGNGRLARALLMASLAREGGISSPIVPLAPAFYKQGAKVAESLYALSRDGDWNKVATTLLGVIGDAVAMSRQVRAT